MVYTNKCKINTIKEVVTMTNYILTVQERKTYNKRNPLTRKVEFSTQYDDLKLENAEVHKYLNSMLTGNLKGYFVTDIKKAKDKKAD